MKKVIGLQTVLALTLERVIDLVLDEDAEILLVEADAFVANKEEVVTSIKNGLPVIFYGLDPLERFVASGLSAASYSHLRNTGYIQLPYRTVEDLVILYDRIVRNRKIENKALTLLSKVSTKRYLTNVFLHDLHPGKKDYEATLRNVERDLGITGTLDEVREKLEILRSCDGSKSRTVAEVAKGEVIPGVFCDIEGTLIVGGGINSALLEKLNEHSLGRAVTLWTGGDVEDVRKFLTGKAVHYPLVSKYDFFDCKVETVIDDLPPQKFLEEYGIVAREYIQVPT